jgi:hypothetical protein
MAVVKPRRFLLDVRVRQNYSARRPDAPVAAAIPAAMVVRE